MKSKLHRVKAIVEKIRKDSEGLQKKGFLSERGKGQMDVVRLIEEALKD